VLNQQAIRSLMMMSLSELEHDLHEKEEFAFIYRQLLLLTERIERLEELLEDENLGDC